jgi:AcrR family transcriptional regulator
MAKSAKASETVEPVEAEAETEASWQDRALERSLRTARAKAVSRSEKFIATAMEILEETGRTDFTVQELVDRSRTSLRSFYQYFSGKDELLLALLEESIAQSVAAWRKRIEGMDTMTALRTVVASIYGDGTDPQGGLNRGLAPYHVGLSESHNSDYQRAVAPMARVIHELVDRGVAEGTLRSDIPASKLTRVFIESVIGAALFRALSKAGGDHKAEADAMWEFCRQGLVGPA